MALCDVQLQVSGYFFAFLIPIIYKYCLENTNLFVNNTHKCKIVFSFILNRRKKKPPEGGLVLHIFLAKFQRNPLRSGYLGKP